VIRSVRPEALDRGHHALTTFQRLAIEDLLPTDLGQRCFRRTLAAYVKRCRNRQIRSWSLAVDHEEIMVVDPRRDRLLPGVPEYVRDLHLRAVTHEPHGLAIFVAIPRCWIVNLLDELGGIARDPVRPFAGVDDLVQAEVVVIA